MELLRYVKYVLADQFQVQKVDEQFLCVVGPFVLDDGQYIEVYLREEPGGLELIFFPGLAERLTLEAMHELRSSGAGQIFQAPGVQLHPDRLSLLTQRDQLLEELARFNGLILSLDRLLSTQARSGMNA